MAHSEYPFRKSGKYPFSAAFKERSFRLKYHRQGVSAAHRGILFKITFEEWVTIWVRSGHWHERGNKKYHYVMARNGDVGPYKIGNVRIITRTENSKETWVNKKTQILNRPNNIHWKRKNGFT